MSRRVDDPRNGSIYNGLIVAINTTGICFRNLWVNTWPNLLDYSRVAKTVYRIGRRWLKREQYKFTQRC